MDGPSKTMAPWLSLETPLKKTLYRQLIPSISSHGTTICFKNVIASSHHHVPTCQKMNNSARVKRVEH
jgi:hypothetical protein